MKIAMVSEHASPLAALGEADAGGQNVHVAELALGLARLGHEVDVYTRRDDPDLPERVPAGTGVTVVHVPAGPPQRLPKDELLPHMDDFADWMAQDWARTGDPQVVHAHFWMSGLAALRAARQRGVPVAQTFHALGSVKRRHQREADTSPAERLALEHRVATEADVVVATCTDEVGELGRMGVPTDHVRVVPCGVDTAHFTPVRPRAGRAAAHRAAPAARRGPAGRAQGLRPRRAGPRRPPRRRARRGRRARRPSSSPTTQRRGDCARWPPSSASTTGSCSPGSSRTPTCPRSTARPTSCWRCRGTSRSASPRSRRRPVAGPWWAPPWAGCSTPSTTAAPAGWCPRATCPPWWQPCAACSTTPTRRRRWGGGHGRAR